MKSQPMPDVVYELPNCAIYWFFGLPWCWPF
jgi:hypothetical protein